MALRTIQVRALVTSAASVEQLLQQRATHLMHGRTESHFAGLQIQVSESLAILQHTPIQSIDFFFRFSAKCLRGFFFNCSNSFSSSSFEPHATDKSSTWDKRRKAWYRSTSFSTFSSSGPKGRFRAWVLPPMLTFHRYCGPCPG
jgi:hypothetical protein